MAVRLPQTASVGGHQDSDMAHVPTAFQTQLSIRSWVQRARPLSCSSRKHSPRPTQAFPTKASSTNRDDAYVFQPSPFRAARRRLHTPSTDTSVTSVESGGVSDLGDGAEVFGEKSTRKRSKSDRPPPVKSRAKTDFLPKPAHDLHFHDHDDLISTLSAIQDDPLSDQGGRIVTFRGSAQAQLMIVGEAPGEQEDKLGIPFVGRAGQLLDKIFKYGGFDVDTQIYLTNVVKRRPPNNRDPTVEEIAYFLPYLHEEIRLVDPVIIVLAGSIATKAFLGQDVRITQVRGTWFGGQLGNPWIIPIFHPSYLLRFEAQKFKMVTDIEAIRAKYMQLVSDDTLAPLSKK